MCVWKENKSNAALRLFFVHEKLCTKSFFVIDYVHALHFVPFQVGIPARALSRKKVYVCMCSERGGRVHNCKILCTVKKGKGGNAASCDGKHEEQIVKKKRGWQASVIDHHHHHQRQEETGNVFVLYRLSVVGGGRQIKETNKRQVYT